MGLHRLRELNGYRESKQDVFTRESTNLRKSVSVRARIFENLNHDLPK